MTVWQCSFVIVCKIGQAGFLGIVTANLDMCDCMGYAYCNLSIYTDINECQENLHSCDINALCTNTEGGYNCTCNEGYSGEGFICSE